MLELPQRLNVDELADTARALWRTECARVGGVGLELFVKVALRHRARRDLSAEGVAVDRAFESGLAVRALRTGLDTAGFAASTGLSSEAAGWAAARACSCLARVSPAAPAADAGLEEVRRDLDDEVDLPEADALRAAVAERPHVRWAEAGTTVEVIVGPEGWLAIRRRHRFWACRQDSRTQLVAKRGLVAWAELLDGCDDEHTQTGVAGPPDSQSLILSPEAAAPVIAALVGTFHTAESPMWKHAGRAWSVSDEPNHPAGLSGGAFDDVGFPTGSRILASGGSRVADVGGPGTLWRPSYREPPRESASNITMFGAELSGCPGGGPVARHCRLLRLSSNLWVLELEIESSPQGDSKRQCWLRVHPKMLLDACQESFGRPRTTSEGVIASALVLNGLAVT